MQSNNSKNVGKVTERLNKMNLLSKLAIKHGIQLFTLMLLLGVATVFLYHYVTGYDYTFFLGTQIIKTSFFVLAETIIAALL